MAGHTSSQNVILNGAQQVLTAATPVDQAVSNTFRISNGDSLAQTIRILTGSTAAVNTTTAKLQSSFDGNDWQDHETVSMTAADTYYYINHNVYDGGDLPTGPIGRIVVNGTTVTLDIDEIVHSKRP